MAFMRGSICAMDPGAPMVMGAEPAEDGVALVYPGIAKAVASAATERASPYGAHGGLLTD